MPLWPHRRIFTSTTSSRGACDTGFIQYLQLLTNLFLAFAERRAQTSQDDRVVFLLARTVFCNLQPKSFKMQVWKITSNVPLAYETTDKAIPHEDEEMSRRKLCCKLLWEKTLPTVTNAFLVKDDITGKNQPTLLYIQTEELLGLFCHFHARQKCHHREFKFEEAYQTLD